MNSFKQLIKFGLYAGFALVASSCSDDNNLSDPPTGGGDKVYVLGLGVTTTDATTNYVLQTGDLMNGTISLVNNGILQEGYRDYTKVGAYFYSVGGLGVTDVNTMYLDQAGELTTKTGLNFVNGTTDFKDADGTGETLLNVAVPANPETGSDMHFTLVNADANTITQTATVAINDVYPTSEDWLMHTGIVVRGNQAFQTFTPIDHSSWATTKTDKAYVAVYSYPDFELQKVIEDDRTGPAGAFGTRSGIFRTESGDIYTVSHNGYGYSQSTKDPAILKIPAGSTEFDADYYFNTADAENGGRIVHALYIGDNKLFAEVSYGESAGQWTDANLRFAIVDLEDQTITAVTNSPTFVGNGGRSFAAMYDDGKAYAAATVDGVCNIYQIDVETATAVKGAQVDATFVGAIERLK